MVVVLVLVERKSRWSMVVDSRRQQTSSLVRSWSKMGIDVVYLLLLGGRFLCYRIFVRMGRKRSARERFLCYRIFVRTGRKRSARIRVTWGDIRVRGLFVGDARRRRRIVSRFYSGRRAGIDYHIVRAGRKNPIVLSGRDSYILRAVLVRRRGILRAVLFVHYNRRGILSDSFLRSTARYLFDNILHGIDR